MPKMGESIMEATILKWLKQEGDKVEVDETVLEIATDKVDSDIPSPVEGVIKKILHQEDEVVEIGKVIAIIETEGEAEVSASPSVAEQDEPTKKEETPKETPPAKEEKQTPQPAVAETTPTDYSKSERFYSPLVKNMAKEEGIDLSELEQIPGTGLGGRVTKADMLSYIKTRGQKSIPQAQSASTQQTAQTAATSSAPTYQTGGDVEIIEMDRMRKVIADHMVKSKQTSPHVTSFVEVDVTNLVNWRNKVKNAFLQKYDEKITFTPIFIEAIVKAIKDFPLINISVDGDKIIRKKAINIGMATALPSGNLIVPVIKNSENLNLLGLAKQVNDLAGRARANKLKPDDIQGGTFTITNVGTFGNVMGTPIINQPQVAIMATGAIKKKPAVLETEAGDVIAIRHLMYLSMSYDHRVVDGSLGGAFIRKVADYLEAFDYKQDV